MKPSKYMIPDILWVSVLGVGLLALFLRSLPLVHIPRFTIHLVKGPLTQVEDFAFGSYPLSEANDLTASIDISVLQERLTNMINLGIGGHFIFTFAFSIQRALLEEINFDPSNLHSQSCRFPIQDFNFSSALGLFFFCYLLLLLTSRKQPKTRKENNSLAFIYSLKSHVSKIHGSGISNVFTFQPSPGIEFERQSFNWGFISHAILVVPCIPIRNWGEYGV
ncbi:Uncharacterized protein Fot_14905 [Forsythia ovata]|uniref:Uncharacterized protein n=1 Tax=Forsythia ovata TaxID=205694 RepID=A0ABD1W7Y2_9LAMI